MQMNQAADCLPRHQTWAGYASSTDVHNFYTQHYIITLLLLLCKWQSIPSSNTKGFDKIFSLDQIGSGQAMVEPLHFQLLQPCLQ